jgi:hypothetical protein
MPEEVDELLGEPVAVLAPVDDPPDAVLLAAVLLDAVLLDAVLLDAVLLDAVLELHPASSAAASRPAAAVTAASGRDALVGLETLAEPEFRTGWDGATGSGRIMP